MLSHSLKSNLKTNLIPLIICILILNILSLTSLYSSLHQGGEFKGQTIFYRQVIWIVVSWLILIIFSLINYRLFYDLSLVFYVINLLLLIAVYIFGKKAMGAQRWLSFMGLNFQPSELAKISTILILARFFSQENKNDLKQTFFLPFALTIVTAFLILKQPDLGTSMIIILLFLAMGLLSPLKKRYFIALIIAGMLAAPLGWNFLKDYQKKRLTVFINPNVDPLGAGYTIIQSKIAIGSGKVIGKGFLSGTQNQFNFLPERHTDFIFTVIAEEWGLAGSIFLLLIYWIIIKKILAIAQSAKDSFGKMLALGASSLFFMHVFINIGMTLGILPVVGLPLVFLSYGGTNLLINFILLGILINIANSN